MPRMKLVMADTDERYIDGLGRYIRNNCDGRMDIHIFTRQQPLEDFLQVNLQPSDIVLAAPELLSERLKMQNKGCIIVLSDTKVSAGNMEYPCLYKYQPGERLYNSLLDLYTGATGNLLPSGSGRQTAKILTVFSPQGGSGKSVVAMNLAICYARMGLKVFFLCLDPINCTPLFFSNTLKDQGFTDILYYLKQKDPGLSAKIDANVSCDAESGIRCFTPPDCAQDMEEVTGEEMVKLLSLLKDTGKYDLVITDADACLYKRNFAVLTNSDALLMVLVPEHSLQYKITLWEEQIKKTAANEQRVFSGIVPVINRCTGASVENAGILVNGLPVKFKIPVVSDLYLSGGDSCHLNPNSRMGGYMTDLAGSLLEKLQIQPVGPKV
jgi:cellulose biosynthesis protein BcsQ